MSYKPNNILGIFRQLSLFQVTLAASFLLILSYFFYLMSNNLAESLEKDLHNAFDQQNLTVVDIASSRVGFHIANDVAENVRLLGQFPAMQRLEHHNGTRDMEKVNTFAAPRVDGFVLFDAKGDYFSAFPESMQHIYQGNQSTQPFFQVSKETSSLYFSNWFSDGEHLKMRVSAPIYNRIVDKNFPEPTNQLSGVIMAQIDFDRTVASELGRLKSSGIMHWIIDEQSGDVLYHSVLPRITNKNAVDSDESTLAKKLLQAYPTTILEPGIHRTKINGKDYSIASARSTVGPHKILVNLAYDDSSVTNLVHEKTSGIYQLGIIFLIVVLIGAWITLLQIAKRQTLITEKEHLARELSLEEDKKKLREQVFQLQKMESLGSLAAGTAHELNNALTGPLGMLSILSLKPDMPQEKRSTLLNKAMKGIEQARSIVEGLLRFSRSERDEKHVGDINEDVRFAINMYEKELEHAGIQLHCHLPDDLPDVSASHRQIQQVILNLITNAKYVLNQGDSLSISTKSIEKNDIDGVLIQITDTGPGMNQETLQRIFEPFFSTKPVGDGTGLGLSICYGIIQEHNGTLDVQSRPDEGTTFTIWLPLGKEA